ncbi:hypothetical protein DM397_15745 [Flavobacterium nitrogenifigens]|nr:hypothetical protein DM397_15745 [Flavobacterium nitrogenifigens]
MYFEIVTNSFVVEINIRRYFCFRKHLVYVYFVLTSRTLTLAGEVGE